MKKNILQRILFISVVCFSITSMASPSVRTAVIQFPWSESSEDISSLLVEAFDSQVSQEAPLKEYGKVTLSFEQTDAGAQQFTLSDGINSILAERLNTQTRAYFQVKGSMIQGDVIGGYLEGRPSFQLKRNSQKNSIQSVLFELLDHLYHEDLRYQNEFFPFRKNSYDPFLDFFVLESDQSVLIIKENRQGKIPTYEAIFSFSPSLEISYGNPKDYDAQATQFAQAYVAYYAKEKAEGYDIDPVLGIYRVGKKIDIKPEILQGLADDKNLTEGLRYLKANASDETRAIFLFLMAYDAVME